RALARTDRVEKEKVAVEVIWHQVAADGGDLLARFRVAAARVEVTKHQARRRGEARRELHEVGAHLAGRRVGDAHRGADRDAGAVGRSGFARAREIDELPEAIHHAQPEHAQEARAQADERTRDRAGRRGNGDAVPFDAAAQTRVEVFQRPGQHVHVLQGLGDVIELGTIDVARG